MGRRSFTGVLPAFCCASIWCAFIAGVKHLPPRQQHGTVEADRTHFHHVRVTVVRLASFLGGPRCGCSCLYNR